MGTVIAWGRGGALARSLADDAATLRSTFGSGFAEWVPAGPAPGSWQYHAPRFAEDARAPLGIYRYIARTSPSSGASVEQVVDLPIVRGEHATTVARLDFADHAAALDDLSSVNPAFERIRPMVDGLIERGIPATDRRARAVLLELDPDPAASELRLVERDAFVRTPDGIDHPLRLDEPMHELVAGRPFGLANVDARQSAALVTRSTDTLLAFRDHRGMTDRLWDANRLIVRAPEGLTS